MDTQSIVKRIIDLKKVSVELKQSTEDPSSASNHLIQSILQLGKSMTSQQSSKNQKQNQASQAHQSIRGPQASNPLFKFLLNANGHNQSEAEPSMFGFESSAGTGRIYQESLLALTPAQQINELRHHNSDLEQQIKNLKDKLKRLEEIERQQREQEWKDGLPYFVINIPKLRIFFTKLTIAEKDYDKIDYCYYSVNLNLDKITLTQLPQSSLASRPPKSLTLMLLDLKQASYHTKKLAKNPNYGLSIAQKSKQDQDQNMIVYYFRHQKSGPGAGGKARSKSGKKSAFSRMKVQDKVREEDQEIVETLFMRFESEEQLKEWDLGVFVNYKIMEDVNKGDFKMDSYNSMNSSSITHEEPVKKQTEKPNGKNIQFNQLIQRMSQKKIKPTSPKDQDSDAQPSEHPEHPQTSKPPSLQKTPNSQTDLDSPYPKKPNNNIKIIDQIESPPHDPHDPHDLHDPKPDPLQQQIINKQRSNTSHFGGLPPAFNEEKMKQAQLDRVQAEEAKRLKLVQMEEMKRKEAERMEAMRKMEYELSIKRARESLRKGYILTKYAKSALHPYEKKVYLSEDNKRLCWQDSKSPGDPKWIQISQIVSVSQGTLGKGVESHLNIKKIGKKGLFVVIYLDSKDRKTLDLSARDQATMEEFCKDLELFRKSVKLG